MGSDPENDDARPPTDPRTLYLDLLKKTLTRYVVEGPAVTPEGELRPFDAELRGDGRDIPRDAETMIGLRRLDNLELCIKEVLERRVPGDLVETGVWRGGAAIFMRAVLEAYGDRERQVWAADSFEGLPRPDPERYPADVDAASELWTVGLLAVSLEDVQANFARYGLLDDRVRFLTGWFRDTLPAAPIERVSVLRLDADMYESTIVALQALYGKVSVGGYVIVDDYGCYASCRSAVDDFRAEHGVSDEIRWIDWSGVFWRKSG